MSTYTFGFIGTGNMGGALAKAARKSLAPEQMLLSDAFAPKAEELAAQLGCKAGAVKEVAQQAKYIFLGVKPQMMQGLLTEIGPILAAREDRFVLVTMAAGLTMERINVMAGGSYPTIRIMPNIPCAVGAGVILYDSTRDVTAEELAEYTGLMKGAGLLDQLDEHLIDAGSSVSGAGPAYVAMFIEALADGGVATGLPRAKAQLYATAMVEGAAKLLLTTGQHPGQLKDAVCSPGGSTIAGVRALEQGGMRYSVMQSVIDATARNKELGK